MAKDYLILITSDLLIHTLELREQTNEDPTGSHQINILSTLDCKNELPLSDLPKLKRLIMCGMLKDSSEKDTFFVLFENMNYFTVTLGSEVKTTRIPIVESFTKSEMEMRPYSVLVDIVATRNHVYRIVQN